MFKFQPLFSFFNKPFILISLLIHAVVFACFGTNFKHPSYIQLPIDVRFYSVSSVQAVPIRSKESKIVKLNKRKDADAIKIKKKSKAAKKAEAKKQQAKGAETIQPDKTQVNAPSNAQSLGGTSISLDTKAFPFAYYTNAVTKKISQNWGWANKFGKLKTVIFFKIAKDGTVADAQIKNSSGDSVYDTQALRSVMLSSPFPPLPEEYKEQSLGVFFEFAFTE